MLSIGQQLSNARAARGLTVEDVAFHTRIPAARVRDMENDDLSKFANLTYARGFLKIYSEFLELDISDYLSQFSTGEFATASGHEYVLTATATQNLPAAVIVDTGRSRHAGLYILLLAVLAAGGIVWWHNRGAEPDEIEARVPDNASIPPESAAPSAPTPAIASAPPAEPPPAPAVAPARPVVEEASQTPDEEVTPAVEFSTVKPPKAHIVEEEEDAPPPEPGSDPPR